MGNLKKSISLFPTLIVVNYDSDTNKAIPCDNMGFVHTREKIEATFKSFMEFYDTHSDESIKLHNDELYKEMMEEINNPKQILTKKKQKEGYVYFIKADNGLIKIGETLNLKSRLKAIKNNMLCEIEFLFAIKTNDTRKLEESLHKKFDNKREKGEWFNLTERDISSVKDTLTKKGYNIDYLARVGD